jgi:hypothetical protein
MTAMPTPAVDICDIYRRAVEILDRDGWCQGTEQDHTGRHCAQGALRIAAGWSAKECADMALENAVLRPLQQHLSSLVTVWNDAPGRTEAEVRASLVAVAEITACTGPVIHQELGMWGSDR